jgi:hypothetical protein
MTKPELLKIILKADEMADTLEKFRAELRIMYRGMKE